MTEGQQAAMLRLECENERLLTACRDHEAQERRHVLEQAVLEAADAWERTRALPAFSDPPEYQRLEDAVYQRLEDAVRALRGAK